ncbi:hypothetical protein ACIGW8_11430 [Streptomyces sioyaensis]|uniref:hypothetical protein n=1 Tax=Streptomyces sioyaensis TaxID=67364 RepID=UPI0037CF5666
MFRAPPIRPTTAVAGLLLLTAGLGWPPSQDTVRGSRPDCTGRRIASWSANVRHTADFIRYGNDNTCLRQRLHRRARRPGLGADHHGHRRRRHGRAAGGHQLLVPCTAGPLARSARPLTPPPPPAADPQYVAVYNPQAQPAFTADGGLLLSYDINWRVPPGPRINGDVALYRPRFLRVRPAPDAP